MKRNIYSIICIVSSLLLCFSCEDTSSLEDRLDNLEGRVTALEEVVAQINSNAVAYRMLIDDEILLLSVTEREDGTGYDIELSNGETVSIYRSVKGEGITPIIGIDESGNWTISVDGGETFLRIEGTYNAFTSVGDVPQLRVNRNNYWEISTDGGETWSVLTDADGNPFEASTYCLTDSYFKDVEYDEESGELTLTLADGQVVTLGTYRGLQMTLDGYTEGMGVYLEEELVMGVTFSDDVDAVSFLSVPTGWRAQITEDDQFIVTIPSYGESGEYVISLCISSGDIYIRAYNLVFTLNAIVYDPDYCLEWNEFIAGADSNVILDFSFAGYDHGESAPPDVSTLGYTVYDVTDYGAVPNDGISDRDAFIAALEAAVGTVSEGTTSDGATVLQTVSKNFAKAIVYFPEGEFILHTADDDPADGITQSIIIRAGDFVLKGAGRDKTKLVMQSPSLPVDPSVLYSSPLMLVFKHYTGFGSVGNTVIENSAKGEFSVKVSSTTGISVGSWVNLAVQNANADVVATEVYPYSADSSWEISQDGVKVDDMHQVASISGNTVTFVEPLMHDIDASWGWEIQTYSYYENVGVEDLTFVGNAKADFKHHGSWEDDGAYKPLGFQRLVNSWVRRVGFTSVSEPCSISTCANCSAYDITVDGNRGHAGVRSQSSSRVLIAKVTETSDGLNASGVWTENTGQWHATGVDARSLGAVLWRNTWGCDGCFESHASQPRATLIDCCTGGWMRDRQGGATVNLPNHLADLTIWNFNSTTPYSGEFIWWDVSTAWKFLPPIIVGFHGETCSFVQDQLLRDSEHGNIASPESLYEAQLNRRLGYVPAWLEALK